MYEYKSDLSARIYVFVTQYTTTYCHIILADASERVSLNLDDEHEDEQASVPFTLLYSSLLLMSPELRRYGGVPF